ncbi:MAG: alginate export family protein [Verrucomicrobiota bacterium]
MKKITTNTTLAALALASSVTSLSADPIEAALDDSKKQLSETIPGTFSVNARLRYEVFDLDNGNPALDRDGTSIRVRYGYTTPDFEGFKASIEGETLSRVGGEHDDIHPLDDAGDGTDLNQAWVSYTNADFGSAKVGRQIYALDDQRFIGHVGWRQNIQVFDAATFAYTGVEGLTVNGFYIDERHLVNGAHNETNSFGLNVSYAFAPAFKLTGFYYDIEGDDVGNAGTTNKTVGARAAGSFKFEELTLKYTASFATQGDVETGEEGDYFAGDLSAVFSGVTVGAGFEIMEAGFRTPYATVHKFSGFADVFATSSLTGIAQGLEDYYVYAGYTIPVGNGIKAKVIYHWFDPETGTGDYGDELDLVAVYKLNKYLNLVGKYGSYSSDGGAGGVGGADKDMFTFELNLKY